MPSRFPIEHLPIADLRQRLGEAIDRVERDGERAIIVRNGREAAALVRVEDLRLFLRLLGEAEDRADLAAAAAARSDDEPPLPLEQVLGEIGLGPR